MHKTMICHILHAREECSFKRASNQEPCCCEADVLSTTLFHRLALSLIGCFRAHQFLRSAFSVRDDDSNSRWECLRAPNSKPGRAGPQNWGKKVILNPVSLKRDIINGFAHLLLSTELENDLKLFQNLCKDHH